MLFSGIYLSCAWAGVANNTCENNSTGIQIAGGSVNVVANNTCNNNGTGISAGAANNMIVSSSVGNNSTAGISSTGSGNNYLDNLFATGNAVNFISGGSGDNIIAYKTNLSASGGNYFYPPLIDDQHTNTIVNGMGRTDLAVTSTNISGVQPIQCRACGESKQRHRPAFKWLIHGQQRAVDLAIEHLRLVERHDSNHRQKYQCGDSGRHFAPAGFHFRWHD